MGTEVFILGKKLVDYTDRRTGEQINGYTLYFFCKSPDVDGHYCDNIWIDARRSPELFKLVADLVIDVDFIPAELVYIVIPGRRSQQLAEIKIKS